MSHVYCAGPRNIEGKPRPYKSASFTVSAGLQCDANRKDARAVAGRRPDRRDWSIASGPAGGALHGSGGAATFSGPAGDYEIAVLVEDGRGGKASLGLPLRIVGAVCALPARVHAILLAKCAPCHTTGASGGLKLDTAENAYANLVRGGVLGAGCTDRTRVVPGDPAGSYVIAKLRAAAGIFCVPMPRNRPALPEEEIAVIENWIAGLPH